MTRKDAIGLLKIDRRIHKQGKEDKFAEAIDLAIHELEIQEQKAKCRKCEHYRYGENIFHYCVLNRDDRKAFICEFEERKGL